MRERRVQLAQALKADDVSPPSPCTPRRHHRSVSAYREGAGRGSEFLPPSVMPMMGDGTPAAGTRDLLVNAIEFTRSGGRVTMSTDAAAGSCTCRWPTREGISPEFLPHLLERFQQADSAANRRHAGLGLGLSLVGQLVDLHGGRSP
jgi:hypothetical protein